MSPVALDRGRRLRAVDVGLVGDRCALVIASFQAGFALHGLAVHRGDGVWDASRGMRGGRGCVVHGLDRLVNGVVWRLRGLPRRLLPALFLGRTFVLFLVLIFVRPYDLRQRQGKSED